jgi:hypothetical protein
MKGYDDAFLGRMANQVGETLRNLKRQVRELGSIPLEPAYSAEQESAAQTVIAALACVDDVFSGNRLSDPLLYCECCTDPAFIARLTTTARDDLSEDDIASVAGSLLYTLGETADLAYFVPRFCGDSLGSPLYDVDAIFARFPHAGFDEWPEAQQSSVRSFLLAHWRFSLLFEPRRNLSELTDPWLVTFDSIASVGDIEDALRTWETTITESADARFLELLDRLNVGDNAISISGVGGYPENAEAYEKLGRWLRSLAVWPRIGAVLESSRATDRDAAERIDGVLAALNRLM